MNKTIITSLLVPTLSLPLLAGAVYPELPQKITSETAEQKETRLAWWRHDRFGMFIHFGLYAVPGRHEWIRHYEAIDNETYDTKYLPRFNPDLFDAKEWARLAKAAGMKYVVLTTKHHEGFCMWDTATTDYKITRTEFGRDLVREYVDAFRAEGIKVGFYFSIMDWHHPDYTVDCCHPLIAKLRREGKQGEELKKAVDALNRGRDMDRYRAYMFAQVRELLTKYGRIDVLWYDFTPVSKEFGKTYKDWDAVELVKLTRSLQPQVILDNRLDLLDTDDGWDFVTPEQVKVEKWPTVRGQRVPWETCQTFSGSWGYHRDENTWKSESQLIELLVHSVSMGGNLIMNVGPTARGEFDERAKARLAGFARWMHWNARSVYGCTMAPEGFTAPNGTLLTYNPEKNRLYVHLCNYPMGFLPLKFFDRVAYAQFLHDGSEVQLKGSAFHHSQEGDHFENVGGLNLPVLKPNVTIPVVELFLKDPRKSAVSVSDTDGLLKALDAVRSDAAAPHEIVLQPGRYFIPKTIELDGKSVSGLTLRAAQRGTAELNGGRRLAGWKKEPGSDFWYADVPGFAGEGEFFRMLVKNGRWVELATYPGKGRRLEHTARFTAALLPNLVGHWSRKPTDDENRLMPYVAADLPDAMDLENADLHLFHMWDDSLCRVESVDRAKHVLKSRETPNWPMGAQEKFEYEILNVREGAAPGEWYLDRRKGRVFYRPLPGEDVAKLDFVIPCLTTVLRLANAADVTLDGVVISGSGPKVANRPGYGGCGVAPAVEIRNLENLVLKGVRIANVGGCGLSGGCRRFYATDCDFVFSGAASVFLSGRDNVIENCRITDAGKLFRGSSGTFISGTRVVIRGNEFARIPYSGIIGFGDWNRFEDNDIHHVMQVLHDGAAIYGLHVHGVMRGNSVRDVVALGKGFGVHAYYADEGSHDSVIEGNYAEGMPVPVHNHMTSGIIVRNNRLVNTNGDFCLSFERSINGVFSNNTVVCGGELQTKWLDSVPVWSGNVANGKPWNPARPPQPFQPPLAAPRAAKAPAIDGTFAEGEWPGDFSRIDVTPSRHQTGYSSELVRFMWDDENLYVSMLAANFGSGTISLGSTWGKDDGVRLDLRGGREIQAFNDGTTIVRPAALAKAVRIVALGKGKSGHSNPNLARYEMAIPWSALGVTPKEGLELPFTASSFMSEYGVMKCWDGLDADPKLVLSAPVKTVK